jgi:hypothetical protein
MKHNYRWMAALLIVASLQLAACRQSPVTTTDTEETGPAKVEHLEGAEPTRVTLTEEAAKRLDIQTATVSEGQVGGKQRMVIPYAALIYDTQGATWVYLNPAPLTYVRHPITVDTIEGDQAFLLDGPPVGTAVVTVGVAELYGAEFEFQEE